MEWGNLLFSIFFILAYGYLCYHIGKNAGLEEAEVLLKKRILEVQYKRNLNSRKEDDMRT